MAVSAVQSQDPDWFIVGGGPKLALWNRRAGKYTVILDPKGELSSFNQHLNVLGQFSQWYPLVSKFTDAQIDPKIIAGGTSGGLIAWDFSGYQLFETSSTEDPLRRMASILTVLEISREEPDLSGSLMVGGLAPSIHLVSRIGYPSRYISLAS